MAVIVRMQGIRKAFSGVIALKGVDLTVNTGEVVALLGDNGAGKSTLLKILSGALSPDAGSIHTGSRVVDSFDPRTAREAGIEMVYQDLSLCDTLDVAQNIYLGRERRRTRIPLLDSQRMHRDARDLLTALSIRVPSTRLRVQDLSGGQRQAIAIARAVSFQPRVLILDEPTSALGVREVETVLALIQRIRDAQVGVLFVTHRLQDVFRVTDRIVTLYEGQKVAERLTRETNLEEVVNDIVGAAA
jgi:simple sugar transport system ATP-binding protein